MAQEGYNSLIGYKFRPNDKNIITEFLNKKMLNRNNNYPMVRKLDICNYEPSQLLGLSGDPNDQMWFFFNPILDIRNIKKITNFGYRKVTGNPQVIYGDGNKEIGEKRILVYHNGRGSNSPSTPWIIHEFRSKNERIFQDHFAFYRFAKKASG